MKSDQYYRLLLDDYSAASFTSFSKAYYGTMTEIADLLRTLRESERYKDSFQEMQDAFISYQQGQKDVTHSVAYQQVPLLEPVRLIASAAYTANAKEWEHLNTWRWPYYMRFSKAEVQHLWFGYQRKYVRVMRATITDLQYSTDKEDWHPIGGAFWGFPHMLERVKPYIYNRLAVEDKVFKTLKEAKADYEQFQRVLDTDYTGFCNDIFGDG